MGKRDDTEAVLARARMYSFVDPDAAADEAARQAKERRKMAKQVKLAKGQTYTFKRGGQAAKYPWKEWLNGDLLILEQSEGKKDDKGGIEHVKVKKDFEVDPRSMAGKVKFAGLLQYKVVETSFRDIDGNKLKDALIIKARPMTDAERAEEDKRRATQKELNSKMRKAVREAEKAARAAGGNDATVEAAGKEAAKKVREAAKAGGNGKS